MLLISNLRFSRDLGKNSSIEYAKLTSKLSKVYAYYHELRQAMISEINTRTKVCNLPVPMPMKYEKPCSFREAFVICLGVFVPIGKSSAEKIFALMTST